MWFKNLSLMRLPADLHLPADMETVLAAHPLRSPGPLEMETRGFVSPFSRSDACFSLSSSDAHLIAVGQESRLLPSSVLANAVAERIADHELKTGRKPGKRLRNEFREAVLGELLPRAFIKHSRTCAYWDAPSHVGCRQQQRPRR